jgi:hypothetical protein
MPDDLLDLSPDRAAPLLDAALERQHAERLSVAADSFLAALPAEGSGLGRLLIAELARLSARVETLEQASAAATRSREERLRIDPLRAIPPERLAAASLPAPLAEAGPVRLDPADPDFTGFGWWQAERTPDGSLRWSGAARCATLLLPALGGGELVLTLSLRAPFGLPLDIAAHDWFLDGMPLAFTTVSSDGVVGVFEARVTLAPMPPGARLALLLHGPQYADPARSPQRDTRRMGLGLVWARLERA